MDFEEYERELRHEPEPVPRPSRAGGRRARRRRWNPRFLGLCAVLTLLTLAVLVTALVKFTRRPPPDPGDILLPDYVAQDLLTVNEWSRPGDPLERVNGIVLHYVGNPGTSAQANRNYFESLSDGAAGTYASSHFIVGLEGEVIQCVPLDEIAYASNSRNADTLSIEVCHPDETGKYSPAAYERAVDLTAWLCRQCHLEPEEDLLRHYDVTGKLCPLYFVEHPEAWDTFRADVAAALEALKAAEKNS